MTEEVKRVSLQRAAFLILTAAVYVLLVVFLVLKFHILPDEILCLSFITVAFFFVYLVSVLRSREHGRMPYIGTSYRKLFTVTLAAGLLLVIFSFFPGFLPPFLLVTLLFSAVYEDLLSLTAGIFLAVILSYTMQQNTYYLYGELMMLAGGTLIGADIREASKRNTVSILLLTTAFEALVTLVFYYFSGLSLSLREILFSLFNGILCGVFAAFFIPKIAEEGKRERQTAIEDLLDDSCPLIQDIRRYSEEEYLRARRVSRLAEKCASAVGADAGIAACAGMYYRLGRILGEPEIDNAVKTAENHCFPPEVIRILTEFRGILRLPGSPESAIVHMIDAFISKLPANAPESDWSTDMVIYQTLNEFSQTGVYDQSGLSINQFLTIREILVEEDDLI